MFYFTLAANFCLLFLTINADKSQDDNNTKELFEAFIKTNGKNYETQDEYDKRLNIFSKNLKRAAILQKKEKGTAVYGATPLSDLSETELKNMRGNINVDMRKSNPLPTTTEDLDFKIPCYFDWRDKKVVTSVKDQGYCPVSSVFAAVANIESQYAIKYKKKIPLSEQAVLDCGTVDKVCDDGILINTAYDTIIKLGGLEKEQTYPYTGTQDNCTFDKSKVVVKISGVVELPQDEKKMAAWIVKNGPVVVIMNIKVLQDYRKGIMNPSSTDCKKDKDEVIKNHVFPLIVGFGNAKGIPYWIAKSSFGVNWGEQGYFRMYRGNNTCGMITLPPTSAVLL